MVPVSVAANMGIAINNTRALLEGLAGRQTPFVRTPKYALVDRSDPWQGKRYRVPATAWPLVEILLALWALATIGYAMRHGHYLAIPFLFLYVIGPGYLGMASVMQSWSARRRMRRAAASRALAPAARWK